MKKILVIDDNEDIRSNTAEILELSGYSVVQAADGREGIEKAIETNPDLIICDIMMPVLDGYAVMHAIRKHEFLYNTPFVFLTAKTERTDMRKGMELGADDYITKPFSGTELLNAVDGRLKKMEELRKTILSESDIHGSTEGLTSVSSRIRLFVENRNINLYGKRDRIYAEGNHPDCVYNILYGKVRTFKLGSEGKELVTGLYGEGDFLGYAEVLNNSVYRNSAEALDDSKLAVIPRADFEELILSDINILRKFSQILVSALAETESHLLGLAYNSLRKKVAVALLRLLDKYQKQEGTGIEITRDNLAAIAGTATESLIRTLSDFREEKIITMTDGVISVADRKKLEHVVTG